MPHRRSVPFEDRHDPRAETQIGRYLLQGEITLFEYEAGIWYRKIVNRYRRLIDAPLSSPPSLAMAKSGTEPNNEPLAEIQNEPRTPEQEYHYAKKVYDDAFEALDARGHWAAKSVARVAVHDEPCPAGYFGHLRLGLFDLALHKGLVTKRMALDNCHKIWDRYFRNM